MAAPLRLPGSKGKLSGVLFIRIRARFIRKVQILKRPPSTARADTVLLCRLAIFGWRAAGWKSAFPSPWYMTEGGYGGKPGTLYTDLGPVMIQLSELRSRFLAPRVVVMVRHGVRIESIGPSKSALRHRGGTMGLGWLPRVERAIQDGT